MGAARPFGNGFAMVANDPHQPLTYPSEFHLSHVISSENGLNMLGAVFPGVPLKDGTGDCEELAWVGHAPDVGDMTKALLGSSSGEIRFAKGGIAAIHFDGLPAVGRGELWWLVTAKILGC